MLETLDLLPADPILGLAEQYKQDPRTDKVNLTVGVYQDETGIIPTFESVRQTELALAQQDMQKGYLPIPGPLAFREGMHQWLFPTHDQETISIHYTPGGTGGIRLAAELIALNGSRTIWLGAPTWNNHHGIFQSAGVQVMTYPHLTTQGKLNHTALIELLTNQAQTGDIILLHPCCHNPTGIDPTAEQWQEILKVCQDKQLIPFFDMAYHGFAQSLETDIQIVRDSFEKFPEAFLTYSFSKIMGLYCDRVGALCVKVDSAESKPKVASQMNALTRVQYSNPPAHGVHVATEILTNSVFKQSWLDELNQCRDRLVRLRIDLADRLAAIDPSFAALKQGHGLFALLPISKEQAIALRQDHAIYLLDNGRINIAGVNQQNIHLIEQAISKI